MGPPQASLNPQTLQVAQQAKDDRLAAIQDRLSDDTRDLLVRFGRRSLMSGSATGPMSAGIPGFGRSL